MRRVGTRSGLPYGACSSETSNSSSKARVPNLAQRSDVVVQRPCAASRTALQSTVAMEPSGRKAVFDARFGPPTTDGLPGSRISINMPCRTVLLTYPYLAPRW